MTTDLAHATDASHDEDLLIEVDHAGIALVTLNRPARRNALSSGLMRELRVSIESLGHDASVHAIVLTGQGEAFCAGLDLRELAATGEQLRVDTTGRPWARVPKPIIGAINGVAVTGGLELVLHCDFVVASENASFADTHTRVGVLPGWGLSVLLPQAVGLRRAKEMSFTGNYISAQTALDWGLVNHVVSPGELLATARQLATDIASNDQPAVSALLALYDDNVRVTMAEGLRHELEVSQAWRDAMVTPQGVHERVAQVQDRGRAQQR